MQKFLHFLAFAIVGTVAFCMLFLQVFPILHDFPEWMYQGWIYSELLSGDNQAVAERFQLVGYPVPNSVSQVAIGLLNFVVTPVMAGKLWLAFYLLLSSVLWFVISRQRTNRLDGALHLLLTDLITFGPGFWNGYINFQFGLLFLAFFLYLTVCRGLRSYWLLCAFGLLIFFSHAVVFAVFVLFNLACMVSVWRDRRRRVLLALAPSLLLMGWYALIRFATEEATESRGFSPLQWVQYKAYTVAKQGPFHNFIGHDGKSILENFPLLYQAGFLLNFLVAALLFCWFFSVGWGIIRRDPGRFFSATGGSITAGFLMPVLFTMGLAGVAFLAGGQYTLGVVNLGERFLIIALLLLLLLFRGPKVIRTSLVVICAVLSFYTVSVIFAVSKSSLKIYSVERSAEINDLQQYLGDIYANTAHKHFNHRLFIYADRGVELTHEIPVLLAIDLPTSVVENRK